MKKKAVRVAGLVLDGRNIRTTKATVFATCVVEKGKSIASPAN